MRPIKTMDIIKLKQGDNFQIRNEKGNDVYQINILKTNDLFLLCDSTFEILVDDKIIESEFIDYAELSAEVRNGIEDLKKQKRDVENENS